MGRPSKFTEEVRARVLEAIASGVPRRVGAEYAGISERTLQTFLARARDAQSGPYLQFSQALKKAEATAVIAAVGRIRNHGRDSWQADAWWLERRYPEEWGRQDRTKLDAQLQEAAEQIAGETGLDAAEVVADAKRLLARLD
jgi:hypothetical protein